MNGLTQQVKAFERLTIEAAVHGCRERTAGAGGQPAGR